MVDIGHTALAGSWLLSVYGAVAGTIGAVRRNRALSASAQAAVILFALLGIFSLGMLAVAFVRHDYRYLYVWQTSNNEMPWYYLVSAIWGGMDGSMQLWAVIMGAFAALVTWRIDSVPRDIARWVVPVLSMFCCFFLTIILFLTNPFRLVPAGADIADGNGLNPLLQNGSMLIHPPMLYLGFTGFAVPCAFCLAALLSGNLSDNWITVTRRWTLVAWSFLTAGIILGGHWAYVELGWGGFWAWDPVENASFLPWLTGTAFLHSVMVQERKGMLKLWNVSLAILTYGLTVFGTFLTRSGVVQSVHAFASTNVGWVFLLYLGILAAVSTVLIFIRRGDLRPERQIESYVSREAAFLFNNIVLLAIAFATFWGVMFPVFSEALTGEKSVVGPPFFNTVNVPLFLFLIFLMGVGPLIAWRRMDRRAFMKTFVRPAIAGSLVVLVFLVLEPARPYPALGFGLSAFAIAAISAEVRRGLRVRRQMTKESALGGLVELVRHKPRRYGGFIVHLGVALMTIAITASMAYKIERDVELTEGTRVTVGRYALELIGVRMQERPNYAGTVASIRVLSDRGEDLTRLEPELRLYSRNNETTTEVAIRSTLRDDLYLALARADNKSVTLKVFVNPLQVWLWLGALLTLAGAIVLLVPELVTAAVLRERSVPNAIRSEA